jgi:hypothetical protein
MSDSDIAEHPVERPGAVDTVRVVRGRASAEELAALTVVLFGLRAQAELQAEEPDGHGSRWWKRPDEYQAPSSWQ